MFKLLKQTVFSWYRRDPFTQSSAIAYCTIFSLPALIIIILAIAGALVDESTVRGEVLRYLQRILGKEGGENIFHTIDHTNVNRENILIFIFGIATLFLTAIRLFLQLQIALNNIWGLDTTRKSWKMFLRRRAESFSVIICIGFMLLVSLLITSILTSLSGWMDDHLPDEYQVLIYSVNFLVSYIIITTMFTLLIKILPDMPVRWRAAFRGGAVAGLLFMIGEYALSFYFGISKPQTAYGVAGSLILLLLWVSYSCLILLFGAEFALAYSKMKGYVTEDKKSPDAMARASVQ